MIGRYIVTRHVKGVAFDGRAHQGRADTRMRSRIARAGLIAAEALGIVVAALVFLGAILFWRVQSAPVMLDWAAPAIASAANAAVFSGAVRDIDGVTLSRAENGEGYRIDLSNVRLGRRAAQATAQLPHVRLDFRPADIFSGKAGPRRIEIRGAQLRIVRRADRKMKLDFGEAAGERSRVFQSLTGGAYFREAFERAVLSKTTITFVDENSGRTWIGKDGGAEVVRTSGGYAARLQSRFDIGGRPASLAFDSNYDLSTEVISSRLTLKDAPVGDLIAVFFNVEAELLTSPISGDATVDLTKDGALLSSRIDIAASDGVLTLGNWSTPVSRIAASAGFDPRRNEFTLERAEWAAGIGEGILGGVVTLESKVDGRGVSRIGFALGSDDLSIVRETLFDEPLRLNGLSVYGSYSVDDKSLDIREFAATISEIPLSGQFAIFPQKDQSPAVRAAAKIAGTVDRLALLRIWPKDLASAAREFVALRMLRGDFSGVEFTMDLKSGAVGEDGALPDEAMTLAFRAQNAAVIYAPGMTPMTNVSGEGALKGNSFRFKGENGAVGRVQVTSASVDIPVIKPKGETAIFRFDAVGDAGDILAVLSQEPLAVLKETRYSASQFAGTTSVSVELQRPNLRMAPRESYRYKGSAAFANLSVDGVIGEAALANGKGRLDLSTQGMTIKAYARLGDAPVTIDWRQRFYGAGDKTVIAVTGVADSVTADIFGIPTRQMIQGPVPFAARAVGGVDSFRALDLEADFSKAILMSEALGWIKPQGRPAKGSATFEFSPETTKISAVSIQGDGVSVKGSATFSAAGALMSLDLPTFSLIGAADLAVGARRREDGAIVVSAEGDYLNAAELVRNIVEAGFGGGGAKAPFALEAKFARVDMRGEASYRNASLGFERNADHIEEFDFKATGVDGKPITVELNKSLGGDAQALAARSGNVGDMLSGLFGLSSVRGGEGRLDFTFTPGAEHAPRKGVLEAHDLRIVKAPLLAKIFAAGSLTGLADLVNGDGIELQNAIARFEIRRSEVLVSEARATGPSVGITAKGSFDLDGEREISLSGAVAPAYQVNSFLGKTPLIGEIFVNKKGEGLLALSYEVDGAATEPRVTVNPLSALAPGVLRRMFEGPGDEPKAANE